MTLSNIKKFFNVEYYLKCFSMLTDLIIPRTLRLCEGTAQAGYSTRSIHTRGNRKVGI